MIQIEDKLYTSTEVADILGVSLRSVYRYLEEDKLKAEVKTATGRHRFSRKNILDFLYPEGTDDATSKKESAKQAPVKKTKEEQIAPVASPSQEVSYEEESVEIEAEVATSPDGQVSNDTADSDDEEDVEDAEESEEEPIDWLAKFREAAKKYREEAEKSTSPASTYVEDNTDDDEDEDEIEEQEESVIKKAPKSKVTRKETTTSMVDEDDVSSKSKSTSTKAGVKRNFYRSSLGGLKDIAQNIDKGSRNSDVDYAFTLNAGLSLYKPIKPFSLLHVYVRPDDLQFFEKLLGLAPADESNAQLCLMVSGDSAVYKNKQELHGLYVVSKSKLLMDIDAFGDSSLVAEASGVLA